MKRREFITVLGGEIGQSIDLAFGVPIFENNILAFDVTKIAQSSLK